MNILYLVFFFAFIKLNDHFLEEKNNLYIYMAAGIIFPINIWLNQYINNVDYIPNRFDMFYVLIIWLIHIAYLSYSELKKMNKYSLNYVPFTAYTLLSIPFFQIQKVLIIGLLSMLIINNMTKNRIELLNITTLFSLPILDSSYLANEFAGILILLFVIDKLFKKTNEIEALLSLLLASYYQTQSKIDNDVFIILYFICTLIISKNFIDQTLWIKILKILKKIKGLEKNYWRFNFYRKEICIKKSKEITKENRVKVSSNNVLVIDQDYINVIFVMMIIIFLIGYLAYA